MPLARRDPEMAAHKSTNVSKTVPCRHDFTGYAGTQEYQLMAKPSAMERACKASDSFRCPTSTAVPHSSSAHSCPTSLPH
jgi:hypothetical protein